MVYALYCLGSFIFAGIFVEVVSFLTSGSKTFVGSTFALCTILSAAVGGKLDLAKRDILATCTFLFIGCLVVLSPNSGPIAVIVGVFCLITGPVAAILTYFRMRCRITLQGDN